MRSTHGAHKVRQTVVAVTLALSLALLAACGDGDDSAPPELSATPPLTIGVAEQRPASVVLPSDYDTQRRYPLVILLHGYGANAMAQNVVFRLIERVTSFQFILVLPEGTLNSRGAQFWDATPECCNFDEQPVDDVGYLASLMREAEELYAVDAKRIRLVGHSNGGYMSYRYICEHPVPVDRIAVLAGSTYIDASLCKDPKPVSVLHLHGTKDETVLYDPYLPTGEDPQNLKTIGAVAAVKRWAAVADCDAELRFVERRDYHQRIRDGSDPAETEIYRATNCRDGIDIELWRSVNADHLSLSVNDDWRDGVAAFLSK